MSTNGFFNTIVETTIHLLPSKLNNLEEGIRSVLSRMLMRYNNDLEGIVLSYDKLQVLEDNAEIFFERPHLHFKIRFRALMYRPIVGSYVIGTVNNVSDGDHIGLLVHGLFNAVLLPTKGALSSDYAYSKADNAWTNSTTQESITVGTQVRLKVTRVEQSAGIVSMQTSMLDDMTGIIR